MKNENNYYYNKKLKKLARKNRANSTFAEVYLWVNLLKARGLMGYSFLRQRPIDNYIVDFFCKDLRLIIEVDGITHEQKTEEDFIRQKKLEEKEYHILRFKDEDVLGNILKVKSILEEWINNFETLYPEVLKSKKISKSSP
jgi:very-short-patch-repair endonuclease